MGNDLEYTPDELMADIAEHLSVQRIDEDELDTGEVAEILGVNRNTLVQYRAAGKLDEWFDYRECIITRSRGYAYTPKIELTEENIKKIIKALNAERIRDDEYTTRDLANIFNVSANTIIKWMGDGKLNKFFNYRKCIEGWAYTPKDEFKALVD